MAIFRGIMFVFLAVIAVTLLTGAPVALADKDISDEEMGLRKKSLFIEKGVEPVKGQYTDKAPGTSTRIERAFENSPPLIPHDITGMLPIALTNNICKGCHMPKQAKSTGAIPIPRTHLMDLATGADLKGKLSGERYNCMQCHVQQVKLPAAVENLFKEEFRDERSKYNSNLADTLNEGVK
jgi:cytochrome c-type protein NapB